MGLIMTLRNCDYEFWKMDRGTRKEVFHCPITNNTLLFDPHYKEGTRKLICNWTVGETYDQLIDILNSEENLVVHWTKVEGTSSDYTIYKDVILDEDDLKSSRKILKKLKAAIKDANLYNKYKFNIVENGIMSKLEIDRCQTNRSSS